MTRSTPALTRPAWQRLLVWLALPALLAVMAAVSPSANAASVLGGPVILGGDDLTDHGCVDGTGNPVEGWLYMQRALENIKPKVNRSNDGSVAALGSEPTDGTSCGNAGSAIAVAAAKAGLTVTYHDGPDAIAAFFDSLAAGTANPAVIWIAGTGADNDLDNEEMQALVNDAAGIDAFVNSGGGLFSHGTAYDWLTALLPASSTVQSGAGSGDLQLTAAGAAAFPGVTDGDMGAGPWHNHFEGDIGGLDVLATSKTEVDAAGNPARVVIGGARVSLTQETDPTPPAEVAPADVGVTKTASAPQVNVGGTITYTLVVTNHGPGVANEVAMTDTLPAGVTYQSMTATRPSCAFATPKVTCSFGTMTVGESATVTVTVRADQAGTLPNSVIVGAREADQNVANNNYTTVNVLVVAPAAPPTTPAPAPAAKPKPAAKPAPKPAGRPVVAAVQCGLSIGTAPLVKGVAGEVTVRATSNGSAAAGKRVVLTGAGAQRAARTGADGVATFEGVVARGMLTASAGSCGKVSKRPVAASCSAFEVDPKGLTAGRPGTVAVRLSSGHIALGGVQVRVRGAGLDVTSRTTSDGEASIQVPASRAGVLVVSAPGVIPCVRRVGVAAVTEPPVTG